MRISDWSSDVCSSDLGEPFRLYDIKLYYPHIGVGFDAPLKIWLKLSILRSAGHQPIAAFIVGHPFKQSCFGSFFKAQQQDRPRNLVTFPENGRKAAFLASATDQGTCKPSAGAPIRHGATNRPLPSGSRRDRQSTRLNSSHYWAYRLPPSA